MQLSAFETAGEATAKSGSATRPDDDLEPVVHYLTQLTPATLRNQAFSRPIISHVLTLISITIKSTVRTREIPGLFGNGVDNFEPMRLVGPMFLVTNSALRGFHGVSLTGTVCGR